MRKHAIPYFSEEIQQTEHQVLQTTNLSLIDLINQMGKYCILIVCLQFLLFCCERNAISEVSSLNYIIIVRIYLLIAHFDM